MDPQSAEFRQRRDEAVKVLVGLEVLVAQAAAGEACETARGGLHRDFGGEPMLTPGTFPISSVCRWLETEEEVELIGWNVTVVPLVIMGVRVAMALGVGVSARVRLRVG